jgi:hypothetical protein
MESCHDASGSPPRSLEEIDSSSQDLSSMLASASLSGRATMLENLVRQALLTGELNQQVYQAIQSINQRQDLTAAEIRILEIIQNALRSGDVRQTN